MTPPELLRSPAVDAQQTSEIGRYLSWLAAHRGLHFADYAALHRWSVEDLVGFWSSVWEFFDIRARRRPDGVLGRKNMPGAEWFPGATLNYAEHALRGDSVAPDDVAITAYSQTRGQLRLSWSELRDQVARARAGLLRLGVGRGDRIVAYLPSVPEAVIAYLAAASLGAIWASCAPEFGARSVIDRFGQIKPTILLAVSGYGYGGKHVDRREQVAEIRAGLPTVRHVVHVPYGPDALPDCVGWEELLAKPAEPEFDPVPFDHPLCVLFSSGTTGKPKAIVHGHGGILIEHLKNGSLSWDLRPGDTMLWFSTTTWMIWNALVSGLLLGASIVLVDGNPLYPDLRWQWRLAEETGATLMGASPGFLMACREQGVRPTTEFDLSRIRQIGAAGSPLAPEGYRWVTEEFGADVLLNVGSGGTDVCTGIVQGSALQPLWLGEISGRALGVDAKAFDEDGHEVVGELGELVITQPMPSMPVRLWDDPEYSRYRETYFDLYPGVWRHGDWVRFSHEGSCVVAGRSDATLNRGGVRLGTAEFYQVIEELPEIADSLVLHLDDPTGGPGELRLYIALRAGNQLDDALHRRIISTLRTQLSPRHTPDMITAVPSIPRNRTGKKLELPAKKVLLGAAVDEVISRDLLVDPQAFDAFVAANTSEDL